MIVQPGYLSSMNQHPKTVENETMKLYTVNHASMEPGKLYSFEGEVVVCGWSLLTNTAVAINPGEVVCVCVCVC